MATRRYSLNAGDNFDDVTEAVGAAVVTKSMEFTFDLASNLTKEQVLLALEKFEAWILKNQFPPA